MTILQRGPSYGISVLVYDSIDTLVARATRSARNCIGSVSSSISNSAGGLVDLDLIMLDFLLRSLLLLVETGRTFPDNFLVSVALDFEVELVRASGFSFNV